MEVGKTVFVAGIGSTLGLATHFMFLQPQFAGQTIIPGVQTATVIDIIVGFIVGVVTAMYAKGLMGRLAGYMIAGTFIGIGLAQQFGLLGGAPVTRLARRVAPRVGAGAIPRASVLAPPGVVVNKHGTVPEMAPGTFG